MVILYNMIHLCFLLGPPSNLSTQVLSTCGCQWQRNNGGWMIFHFSIVQVHFFLLIECHCSFFICYKILTDYVYYCCILIMIVQSVGNSFFFRDPFASFHTHASLHTVVVCFFILFHSCSSHDRVFAKTLLHEFLISYSHTEWYLLFSDSATTSVKCVF